MNAGASDSRIVTTREALVALIARALRNTDMVEDGSDERVVEYVVESLPEQEPCGCCRDIDGCRQFVDFTPGPEDIAENGWYPVYRRSTP